MKIISLATSDTHKSLGTLKPREINDFVIEEQENRSGRRSGVTNFSNIICLSMTKKEKESLAKLSPNFPISIHIGSSQMEISSLQTYDRRLGVRYVVLE